MIDMSIKQNRIDAQERQVLLKDGLPDVVFCQGESEQLKANRVVVCSLSEIMQHSEIVVNSLIERIDFLEARRDELQAANNQLRSRAQAAEAWFTNDSLSSLSPDTWETMLQFCPFEVLADVYDKRADTEERVKAQVGTPVSFMSKETGVLYSSNLNDLINMIVNPTSENLAKVRKQFLSEVSFDDLEAAYVERAQREPSPINVEVKEDNGSVREISDVAGRGRREQQDERHFYRFDRRRRLGSTFGVIVYENRRN
jgi:hypothetical protein